MKQFSVSALFLAAVAISAVHGFDPVTLTIGGTAYVLTAAQTTLGVAALAGLAIAKEKLIISALSRGRGKRDVLDVQESQSLNFDTFFLAIGQADVSDCGKLLVCEIMTTPKSDLKTEEKLIANLFDNDGQFHPDQATNEFQFAAYVGTLQQPKLCRKRYPTCTVSTEELLQVVEAHTGAQV